MTLSNPGGIAANRETELRLGPKGRRVFSKSGWNKCIRESGIVTGNWWIVNYGILRWNKGYAIGQLNWRTKSMNSPLSIPFHETGQWMANFNSRSRTVAVAKNGGGKFWIVIPIGHPVRPETSQQFKTLPAREKAAVAREYRRALIMCLQTGRAAHAAKQQAKADRAAKAQANKVARQAQRDRAAAARASRQSSIRKSA